MPRTLRWRKLTVGLVSLAAVVATALAVLVFGQVGALHGRTFRLYLRTSQARGLMKGSEVWLAGVKVGLVSHVEFLPPAATDTTERLLVAFDVLAPYRGHIRRDSYAQIRSGTFGGTRRSRARCRTSATRCRSCGRSSTSPAARPAVRCATARWSRSSLGSTRSSGASS